LRFFVLSLLALLFGCFLRAGVTTATSCGAADDEAIGEADDTDNDLFVRSQTVDPNRCCARHIDNTTIGEKLFSKQILSATMYFITHNRFPDSCASSPLGRQHGYVRKAPFSPGFVD
jgi:hypothetical protein